MKRHSYFFTQYKMTTSQNQIHTRHVEACILEPSVISGRTEREARISWTALGGVSLHEARTFRDLLSQRIDEAEAELLN